MPPPTEYIELHLHTAFSFLDGASMPQELLGCAAELGYPALAITDHDGLHGAMEFAQAARAVGIAPITGAEVTLTDGSYHDVDSNEMSFKIAAKEAFKKGVLAAKPVLLEPMMTLRVTVPDSYTGDVMSDLNGKRAHVNGMDPGTDGSTTIEAVAPAAEIQRYATDLRSITQGRGTFTSGFSHYHPVPVHLADQIRAQAKEQQEATHL